MTDALQWFYNLYYNNKSVCKSYLIFENSCDSHKLIQNQDLSVLEKIFKSCNTKIKEIVFVRVKLYVYLGYYKLLVNFQFYTTRFICSYKVAVSVIN